jgi:hypothetical protein
MKRIFILICIVALSKGNTSFAGNDEKTAMKPASSALVSGTVVDNTTGEALPGVTLTIEETGKKVFTDLDGKYEISNLTPGNYTLSVSYISYKEIEKKELVLSAGTTGVDPIKLEPLAK